MKPYNFLKTIPMALTAGLLAAGSPSVQAAPPAAAPAAGPTACADGGGVWVASFDYGANCADATGYAAFSQQNKALPSNQIKDIEICGDKVQVVHTLGVNTRSKGKWQVNRFKGISGPNGMDCDAKGNLWLAHYDGVSMFDGKQWKTTKSDKLGKGADAGFKIVKDVSVAPNGDVWVITGNSVARFDGKDWTTWQEGAGFAKKQFFNHVVVSAKGTPYVSAIGAVYAFEDGEWVAYENTDIISNEGLFVDKKGRIYVGTYGNGLFVYEDGGWTNFNRENSEISSNHVRAISVDDRSRVWVATEYGLHVYDGKAWQVYQMHTADLVDNNLSVLEVEGDGPDLPKPAKTKTGTLSGIVTNGKTPAAGVQIQLCVESIGSSFRGDTPCEEQPFSKTSKTGKDGKFEFKDLPAGVYGVVFQQPSGKWARLVGSLGLVSERILLPAGQTIDDIELDLSKVK